MDDGHTVVSRAGRITPRYTGRGLYRYLDQHLIDWAKESQMAVKAFTVTSYNESVTKPSFLSQNKLILNMVYTRYIYFVDEFMSVTRTCFVSL